MKGLTTKTKCAIIGSQPNDGARNVVVNQITVKTEVSKMDKIKIGIVGLGGISGKHIRELLAIPEAEIVAICDIDPSKIAEKNGTSATQSIPRSHQPSTAKPSEHTTELSQKYALYA